MQRTNRLDRPGAFIVIVYGIIQNFGIEGLAIATVVAGIILVIMGALKLGTVIKFIPYPIVVGFTSGIALTIFTTQMKDLFGLTMDKVPADFISKWIAYFEHFDTMNLWSLLIGLTSIVIIAITPKFSKKIPGSLIAIILMTVVVYVMRYHLGITGIETIGDRFTINASRRSRNDQLQYGNDQSSASFRIHYRNVRSDRIVTVRYGS